MVPLTGMVGWRCVWGGCGVQCVISAGVIGKRRLSVDSLDSLMLVRPKCSMYVTTCMCRECLKKLFTDDEAKAH